MKLSPRDSLAFFDKPDRSRAGILIYGNDAMRVSLKREQLLKNLLGPNADSEMRLSRHSGADLKRDPALLQDALKSNGFFPGDRAVFIEDAIDATAPILIDGLSAWAKGDATIVVTAGTLKATSALRKAFENHPNAYCVAIYDEPPSRAEIEAELNAAGLKNIPTDVLTLLNDLARELEPGDFRQTIQKLGLYKYNDQTPLTYLDVTACAPTSNEADLDDLLSVVADGQAVKIGTVMKRLKSQGSQPVTIVIGATRHFRTLYSVASAAGGPSEGIGKLRPPVFGPRRDQIIRQAQNWGSHRLQDALTILTDLDLQLRSANQHAPALELTERALIRLAMLGRR